MNVNNLEELKTVGTIDMQYFRNQEFTEEKVKELYDVAYKSILNRLSEDIHQQNVDAGWWSDLKTGEPLERNVGELLCLVHSEISEAMEGYRKNLQDDKLPHRKMFEVELADAMIRMFDIAGKYKLDLGGALIEKRKYNASRADHKPENRKLAGGKSF